VTPYVDLDGVRTWYDELGTGDALVLLHGGIVDSRFYARNSDALAEHFHVYSPDRRGHGRTLDVAKPMTFDATVDDTVGATGEHRTSRSR
jgi:pimeloyl-ACP methyl ester carboxylesterase